MKIKEGSKNAGCVVVSCFQETQYDSCYTNSDSHQPRDLHWLHVDYFACISCDSHHARVTNPVPTYKVRTEIE